MHNVGGYSCAVVHINQSDDILFTVPGTDVVSADSTGEYNIFELRLIRINQIKIQEEEVGWVRRGGTGEEGESTFARLWNGSNFTEIKKKKSAS